VDEDQKGAAGCLGSPESMLTWWQVLRAPTSRIAQPDGASKELKEGKRRGH
jgi:hypothetical protein